MALAEVGFLIIGWGGAARSMMSAPEFAQLLDQIVAEKHKDISFWIDMLVVVGREGDTYRCNRPTSVIFSLFNVFVRVRVPHVCPFPVACSCASPLTVKVIQIAAFPGP